MGHLLLKVKEECYASAGPIRRLGLVHQMYKGDWSHAFGYGVIVFPLSNKEFEECIAKYLGSEHLFISLRASPLMMPLFVAGGWWEELLTYRCLLLGLEYDLKARRS